MFLTTKDSAVHRTKLVANTLSIVLQDAKELAAIDPGAAPVVEQLQQTAMLIKARMQKYGIKDFWLGNI